MSQKPFMWNRNNPYEYTDPSGFSPSEQQQTRTPAQLSRLTGSRYLARLGANARAQLKVPANAPRISEANARHMFRDAKGHVPDTALNRATLQKTASDPANAVKALTSLKQGGTLTEYRETLSSGAEVWVEVRTLTGANGNTSSEITNGGINPAPINPAQRL